MDVSKKPKRSRTRIFAARYSPWRASNQDCAAGNFSILDHLQDHRSGLAGLFLAYKALRRGSGLKTRGIDAESADVRMRGDEIQTAKVLSFGNGN